MQRFFVALFALLVLTAQDVFASAEIQQNTFQHKSSVIAEDGKLLYAVMLKDAPLAVKLGEGGKAKSSAERMQALKQESSKTYIAALKSKQANLLRQVHEKIGRKPSVKRDFQLAVNALIVALSPREATALRELPGVAAVRPVQRHYPHTDRGPTHIGAPALWLGTADVSFPATRGEGLIVGVIDTGIRPEHPSFADIGDDGYDHVNPLGPGNYLGDCALAAAAHYCNDKLIGIVSYPEITDTFGEDAPPYGLDYEGHGTHVAATVAGNVLHNVPAYGATGAQGEYEFPEISGVAPHANIVAYQVCHQGDRGEGCDTTLTVAAVEHAIENGVNVLNYSIGGFREDPWFSIDAMALLSARAAGIHVAVSAGNEGPEWRTVSSPGTAPWLTSVAAYTHDRSFSDIELGNFAGGNSAPAAALVGKGVTNGYTGAVVLAADHGDALCLSPFAPGTFAGEIVVCERGEIARVAKGVNVLAGGAGGMVLINVDTADDETVADFHALPAIQLDVAHGAQLLDWLSDGAGHTATITATTVGSDPLVADYAAVFSSRGPAYPYADMLAPHVAAPGVQIYAAFTEDQRFSPEPLASPYAALDGTSMASPHVAGALGLLSLVHPDWTPAEVQSALMLTSVVDTKNDLGEASEPYEQGAGRIDIPAAARAGLVMNVTEAEYLAADPNQGGDPSALNMPALSQDDCLLACEWTRRFRAVKAGAWTASIEMLAEGVDVTVQPAAFSVAEGDEVELVVRMRLESDSAVSRWVFGQLNLESSENDVPKHHLPIAANVATAHFPGGKYIVAQRDSDSSVIDGMYSRAADSLDIGARAVMATLHEDVVLVEDATPEQPFDNLDDGNGYWRMYTVTTRGDAIFAEVLDVGADVDMFIARDADGDGKPSQSELDNHEACISASYSGYEYCAAYGLEPGDYWLFIHNFWSEPGVTVEPPLYTALLSGDGTLDVDVTGPGAVEHGAHYELEFSWNIEMEYHDVAFGIASVGDNGDRRFGNIGNVPIRIERLRDDVRLLTSAESVKPGEPVTYTIRVDANTQSLLPRSYVLDLELPPLVELVSYQGTPARSGENLRWEITQPPFEQVAWIEFTVRAHEYFPDDTLAIELRHRLDKPGSSEATASAPPVRLVGRNNGGGGTSDFVLALLPLLFLMRARRRAVAMPAQ